MIDTLYLSPKTIQDIQNHSSAISLKDWLDLIALFLSALTAVLVGQYLQNRKVKRQAKDSLFRTLFSFRGQPVNYRYVNALNQIDIVFHKDKTVLDAWHKLYDSLNDINIADKMDKDPVFSEAKNKEWDKLRHEIIIQMALVVGYNLRVMKPEHLLNPSYSPQGHLFVENFDWDLKTAELLFYNKSVEHLTALTNYYANNTHPQQTKLDKEG